MTGFQQIAEELREFTALKYAGDCKCGKCQLVPRSVLDRTLATLSRLAASRPATQVVDREAVARIIKNHVSVTVSGEAYAPRDNDRDGVASAADAILSLLRPAEPVEPPGMTDLMVTPESLDAFMEANPLPDKPTTPDAVGEPVAWRIRMNDGGCTRWFDGKPPENEGRYEMAYTHPPKSPDTSAASIWETAVARLNGEQGYDWSVHIGGYLWSQIGRSEKTKLEMDAFVDRIFLDVEASVNASTSAAVLAERERCAARVRQLHDATFHFSNVAGDIRDVIARVLDRAQAAIRQLPTPERGDK